MGAEGWCLVLAEGPHGDRHRMVSKYPRSVRGCLPLWTLTLEVALILIFFFFTSYDTSLKKEKIIGDYRGECLEVRWSQRQIAGAGAWKVCGPPGA